MDIPRIIDFQKIGNPEIGYISVAEPKSELPFPVKRVYWVYGTPENSERGNHASKTGKQVLVIVNGEAEVILENPEGKITTFKLNDPNTGLYVPPLHWKQIKLSEKAIILSLASSEFDESDYLRDYKLFKSFVAVQRR